MSRPIDKYPERLHGIIMADILAYAAKWSIATPYASNWAKFDAQVRYFKTAGTIEGIRNCARQTVGYHLATNDRDRAVASYNGGAKALKESEELQEKWYSLLTEIEKVLLA